MLCSAAIEYNITADCEQLGMLERNIKKTIKLEVLQRHKASPSPIHVTAEEPISYLCCFNKGLVGLTVTGETDSHLPGDVIRLKAHVRRRHGHGVVPAVGSSHCCMCPEQLVHVPHLLKQPLYENHWLALRLQGSAASQCTGSALDPQQAALGMPCAFQHKIHTEPLRRTCFAASTTRLNLTATAGYSLFNNLCCTQSLVCGFAASG